MVVHSIHKITSLVMQRGAIRVYLPCHNRRGKGIYLCCQQGYYARRRVFGSYCLLNSDTIVTEHWLTKLYDALFNGDPKIQIVGPLSNAASFQSVPNLKDPVTGGWSINPYPLGWI